MFQIKRRIPKNVNYSMKRLYCNYHLDVTIVSNKGTIVDRINKQATETACFGG